MDAKVLYSFELFFCKTFVIRTTNTKPTVEKKPNKTIKDASKQKKLTL